MSKQTYLTPYYPYYTTVGGKKQSGWGLATMNTNNYDQRTIIRNSSVFNVNSSGSGNTNTHNSFIYE